MSGKRIQSTVFTHVDKATDVYWRKETDKQKIHVYYATTDGLLASNKPLRTLKGRGDLGEKIFNEYATFLITHIKSQGFPDLTTQNLLKKTNKERGIYDWTDPAHPETVAIVAVQGRNSKGTGFNKIKVIAKTAHERASAAMKKQYKKAWTDFEIDLGHVVRDDQPSLTPALMRSGAAKNIIDDREFSTIRVARGQPLTDKETVRRAITKKENAVIDIHTRKSAKYTRSFNTSGVFFANLEVVVVVQQDKKTNNDISIEESGLGRAISNSMSSIRIATLEGSPNIFNVIRRGLLDAVRFGKIRNQKYVTSTKDKKKTSKVKLQIITHNLSKKLRLKTPKVKKQRRQEEGPSLLSIQSLINGVLSKTVEKEMGKSSDPAVKLRYQSGRFAESVELMTLTRSQNALFGTYTYLRNPYDTFLPGHRLNPPAARDPRIYAEGGIRRAAMNIMKRRFPGIALELK